MNIHPIYIIPSKLQNTNLRLLLDLIFLRESCLKCRLICYQGQTLIVGEMKNNCL